MKNLKVLIMLLLVGAFLQESYSQKKEFSFYGDYFYEKKRDFLYYYLPDSSRNEILAIMAPREDLPQDVEIKEDMIFLKNNLVDYSPIMPIYLKYAGYSIQEQLEKIIDDFTPKTKKNSRFENYYYAKIKLLMKASFDRSVVITKPMKNDKQIYNNVLNYHRYSQREIFFTEYGIPNLFLEQGKYYFYGDLGFHIQSGYTNVKEGAQLLKVNGASIEDINPYDDYRFLRPKWHAKEKRFFYPDFLDNYRLMKITYKTKSGEIIKNRKYFHLNNSLPANKAIDFDYYTTFHSEEDQLLYLRLPFDKMLIYQRFITEESLLDSLLLKLPDYKNHKVNQLILDLRGNVSGVVFSWEKLLAAITDEPLIFYQDYYANNNETILEAIKTQWGEDISKNRTREWDGISFIHYKRDTLEITPAENSIRFTGKIFILIDEFAGKSILEFTSKVAGHPRFEIIGTPVGQIYNPIQRLLEFQLPNTGIRYQINPLLMIPTEPQYLLTNNIENPFYPNHEYVQARTHHKGYLFTRAYMIENDFLYQSIVK